MSHAHQTQRLPTQNQYIQYIHNIYIYIYILWLFFLNDLCIFTLTEYRSTYIHIDPNTNTNPFLCVPTVLTAYTKLWGSENVRGSGVQVNHWLQLRVDELLACEPNSCGASGRSEWGGHGSVQAAQSHAHTGPWVGFDQQLCHPKTMTLIDVQPVAWTCTIDLKRHTLNWSETKYNTSKQMEGDMGLIGFPVMF